MCIEIVKGMSMVMIYALCMMNWCKIFYWYVS